MESCRPTTITCTIVGGTIALFLLLFSTLGVLAQKDDPFGYLRSDERLSAELTLRLNGEALKDVVDVIEAATGAKISVDPDIAEDKVTIFCKGQPASEVMVQIAKLFGYHFRRERIAGKLRYTLFRDDATRALEHKLKRGALDEAFDKIAKVVARYAREAANPEGFEKLRESVAERMQELMSMPEPSPGEMNEELIEKMLPMFEDVAFSSFCLSNRGIPLLYSRLNEEQVEMLKDERKVVFSSSAYPGAYPLPEDLIPLLAEESEWSLFEQIVDLGVPDDLYGQGNESEEDDSGPVVGVRVGFEAEIQENGPQTLFLQATVRHLHEKRDQTYGPSGFLAMPIGVDFREVMRQELGLYRQAAAPEEGDETRETEPGDPILQTKVKVETRSAWMADDLEVTDQEEKTEEAASAEERSVSETSPAGIFRQQGLDTISHLIEDLAPQVPVSMVADHYDKQYGAPTSGRTLGRQVSAMEAFGYDCAREDGWFRFRNRTWYMDRSSQIPNRLLLRWIASETKKGGFDLSDLAEMALLSKDQRKGLSGWGTGGLLMVFESLAQGHISKSGWNWIRGFALCPSDQQRRLLAGESIRLAALPLDAQQSLMGAMQDEEAAGWNARTLRRAAFSVSQSKGKLYMLRPGVSTVEEVAIFEQVQMDEEDFESWLEHLQSLDPSIGAEDFEVSTATTIELNLTSGGRSAGDSIRLPLNEGGSEDE